MAEHEDGLTDAGEPRSFNKRSKYGAFIDSVMGLVPVDELRKRGDPVEARTWLGLRFKMGEKVLAGQKNPATGDPVTMNVPVEYLGTEKTADETLADVHEQLQALAWECDDHNDFVEKAFALPGVEGNNHLVMAIADPDGLYQELRNDREATSSR